MGGICDVQFTPEIWSVWELLLISSRDGKTAISSVTNECSNQQHTQTESALRQLQDKSLFRPYEWGENFVVEPCNGLITLNKCNILRNIN